MYDSELQETRDLFQRRTGAQGIPAIAGDVNGTLKDQSYPNKILVRYATSNGASPAFPVDPPLNDTKLEPGNNVLLEYFDINKLRIKGRNTTAEAARDVDVTQPPINTDYKGQQSIMTLHPVQTTPPGTLVNVKAWNPIADKYYEGANWQGNFSSVIPGNGTMRYAVMCVKNDFSGVQVYGSTGRSTADVDLNIDDVNEAIGLSSGMPFWAVRLSDNQGTITQSQLDAGKDLRQFLNVQLSAYTATSDATTTDIVALSVPELTAVTINGEFVASKTDYTASIGGVFSATFRRASGGNVTLVGSANVTSNEDSSGTPALTLAADTGNQTADIRVTGIAAENWKWRVNYKVTKV